MKRQHIILAFGFTLAGSALAVDAAVIDKFTPAESGSTHLKGWLGGKLQLALGNRVMAQDIGRIVKPYQDRVEETTSHWRCEYWGKWFTSAALCYAYEPTPGHHEIIDQGVSALLATQSPDGYIGTYRAGKHLEAWDIWGRKYTLLGLIADFDVTKNPEALAAAKRVADNLIKEAPPGEFNITATGLDLVKGLPPSSILEPFVLLYKRTGEQRYLDFANYIVACWDKPNAFVPAGGLRLVENALQGLPPAQYASSKAYEMISCFSGLCELYRVTGNPRHLEAVIKFAESVRRTEIMVHGSGSNQELWCDGARTQTETLEQPVETCVTATWMQLCSHLLRLTGDSQWADDLEISLYNALMGAMTPKGDWWAYFSPLSGQRVPSHYQHADVQLSCCVANGPRGLFLTPTWATMGSADGVVVNLYTLGSVTHRLATGTAVTITQDTDYPVSEAVALRVAPERREKFSVRFRIPAWSKQTALSVNGQNVPCEPGKYAEITREWSADDKVVLKLDLRGRLVRAPSSTTEFALMRGPILLALDNRLTAPEDKVVRLVSAPDGSIDLQPSKTKPGDVWMAFDVPFEVRPTHFFNHHQVTIKMCDYASAGNRWSSDNLFRVWLPQALFLRNAYPSGTWRLMAPKVKTEECPSLPVATSTAAAVPHGL